MKKITIYVLMSLLFVPFMVSAQNEQLPTAGITPESSFYFLDKFGESLRSFFTFSKAGKARLQVIFASERIAEIRVILEDKGVEAKGLEIAESRLKANLARMNEILSGEKEKGKDISILAKELDEDFDGPRNILKETFKTEKRALEIKIQELRIKIDVARQALDATLVETLSKELDNLKIQKDLLEKKKDQHNDELDQEEDKLEREMDDKDEAEKAILEKEKERAETLEDATEEGFVIPATVIEKFDGLIAQAKELLAKTNYQGAEQLAEQAKKSLEKEKDKNESLKDEREKDEDLKDEQEQEKFEKDNNRLKKEQGENNDGNNDGKNDDSLDTEESD